MMMPANFTAVNSEVVYGGGVLETIGAYTADVWAPKNFKQFNTNLITLVSNTFFQDTVNTTLGTVFGGNWGSDGVKLFGSDGTFSSFLKNQDTVGTDGKTLNHKYDGEEMTGLNKFMRGLGVLSTIYTLGTTSAVVNFNDKAMGITTFNA